MRKNSDVHSLCSCEIVNFTTALTIRLCAVFLIHFSTMTDKKLLNQLVNFSVKNLLKLTYKYVCIYHLNNFFSRVIPWNSVIKGKGKRKDGRNENGEMKGRRWDGKGGKWRGRGERTLHREKFASQTWG